MSEIDFKEIESAITEAIAQASGLSSAEVAKLLVRSKEIKHGDYAFPCFVLAKRLGKPPAECSGNLAVQITLPEMVEKTEVVGPYLNFFLKRAVIIESTLKEIILAKYQVGKRPASGETIVLDYSGTNIAKPFHMGHLRNTLIGHS